MEHFEGNLLKSVFADIIEHNTTPDAGKWLKEKAALISEEKNGTQLNLAFVSVPQKTGKKTIRLTESERTGIKEIHPQFLIDDWTIDRLSRVWLLLQVDPEEKTNYVKKLENLFKAAEMNELVALYSALIGFAYPPDWQMRCAEGIRSNIGIVLEAIMYNNPYPYKYLNEQAWNQLVLKAFFTEKDINRIIGADERANKELADILVDYANERWAAHRTVNPQLWRFVSKFVDKTNFNNIQKAFNSSDITEKKAGALACFYSNFTPAKDLLDREPVLKSDIVENKLNWKTL